MAKASLPNSISKDKLCSTDGCKKPVIARGVCSAHYYHLIKHGDSTRQRPSLFMRFWLKVAITADPEKCWEWQPPLDDLGYGSFGVFGKTHGAHRVAWFLTHGSFPAPPLNVLHDCDNRKCVNPNHLHLGTHQDNMREKVERGRCRTWVIKSLPTKCRQGHERTPENTKIKIRGKYQIRVCLICSKEWFANRYLKVKSSKSTKKN